MFIFFKFPNVNMQKLVLKKKDEHMTQGNYASTILMAKPARYFTPLLASGLLKVWPLLRLLVNHTALQH